MRPPIEPPEGVGRGRPPPVLVVVGEELRLVGRHIHVDRAFRLAGLAGKTEVEGLLHVGVVPTAVERIPFQQLEQQVGAATGGVHLLARRLEARAHRPGEAPALADPEAARRRPGEAAPVLLEAEVRVQRGRVVVGSVTEVLVRGVGVDHLARVHLPIGIPEALERAHRLHEVGPEHLDQVVGVRLSVAVLAGERAAVGENEVGRLVEEAEERPDARLALQVEADARVHAALAVVAEEDAREPVPAEQLREVPQVPAEPLGRNGRILEARPGFELPRNPAGSDRRLAHRPDPPLPLAIGHDLDRRRAPVSLRERRLEAPRAVDRLRFAVGSELGEQPGTPGRVERDVVGEQIRLEHVPGHRLVDRLETDRAVLEDREDVVRGRELVVVGDDGERAVPGTGNETDGRLEHEGARALRPDQRARDVEAPLGQQLVEVVARDAAGDVRVLLADEAAVAVAEIAQPPVDLAGPSAGRGQPLELGVVRSADPEPDAVVGEHVELLDVVGRAAGHHRVHATRVVPDHPAERAVAVRGRIRPEREPVLLGRVA